MRSREGARLLRAPRIGLFGLLGTGNFGNDGSLAAVLGHLRTEHPDATLQAFCSGPEKVTERFGVPATRMNWNRAEYHTATGPRAILLKAFGKIVDAVRTAAWVRRQDVVIVPGMGVLESTQPVRPWGFPFSLLLLCLSGRLVRTRVMLLSVGASPIEPRATRAIIVAAARLAGYRSYRDELSRNTMWTMGLNTDRDPVYTDLVFASPKPRPATSVSRMDGRVDGRVGVGVMAYRGRSEDRHRGEEILRDYVDCLTTFVRWLVDEGRHVRLLTGDVSDEEVAAGIAAEIGHPAIDIAAVSNLDDVMLAMDECDTVVATRYHNVISALRLNKPAVAIGYAPKNDVLMASMGLGEFCQPVRNIDVDRLIEQFTALEKRHEELRATLAERNHDAAQLAQRQLAELSAIIWTASPRTHRKQRIG